MQENHLKSVSKTEVVEKVLMISCKQISGEKIKEDELEKLLNRSGYKVLKLHSLKSNP
jgi:capsular polysaccharide biosynthesis protein